MPITDTFGRMPLDRIWVKRRERQRKEIDLEKGGFLASVALRGVLVPVILEQEPDAQGYHTLYAGERRYAASLTLGLPDIPYRFARSPDEAEIQIIELEENLKRQDLTWQEQVEAVVRIHALHTTDDPGCSYEQTGHSLGWHDGSHVARCHFVHASWLDDAVRSCGSFNEAYNLLQRRQTRARANKLEELLAVGLGGDEDDEDDTTAAPTNASTSPAGALPLPQGTPAAVATPASGGDSAGMPNRARPPATVGNPVLPIANEDFLTWAPSYSGLKFNLIHCDFPYGIKFGAVTLMGGANRLHREDTELYHDGEDHFEQLLECLVDNFDRIAGESCHLMFWYSNRAEIEAKVREMLLRVPGLSLLRFPLIWHKSDNAGFITPGHPRHIYETCLVGVRGDRPIVKYVSDCYSSPSDNSLHMSAKPEPMLRYFMGMFVDEHTRLLDPTCGSGSALRAADALKAERVAGLEINPEMAKTANHALFQARALRRAAGEGK